MSAPTLSADEITFLREFVNMAKKVTPILEKLSGQPRRGRKVAPRKEAALAMANMTKKELVQHFVDKIK